MSAKEQITHFFKALNILKTVGKQKEYIRLVKDRDYNEVMKAIDINEWYQNNSY